MLKQPIDFTVNRICSRCGNCCSSLIPVSDTEINRLARYANRRRIKPAALPNTADVVYMQCPFWRPDEHACAVYPVRPAICRVFQCDKPVSDMIKAANPDITRHLKIQNMWQIYNKTGIRANGEDIPYHDAPYLEIITDQNRKLKISVGRPATVVTNSGKIYANALVMGFWPRPPAIGVIDPDGHKAKRIQFDKIKAIN